MNSERIFELHAARHITTEEAVTISMNARACQLAESQHNAIGWLFVALVLSTGALALLSCHVAGLLP